MAPNKKNLYRSETIKSYFDVVQKNKAIREAKPIENAKSKNDILSCIATDFYQERLAEQLSIIRQNSETDENQQIELSDNSVISNDNADGKADNPACIYVPCQNEEALCKELATLKSKYKRLRKIHQISVNNNFQKDLKITRLKEQLKSFNTSNLDPVEAESKENEFMFEQFMGHFTSLELATLRPIENKAKFDAKFIRLVLSYIYKENLSKLTNKSLRGSVATIRKNRNGSTNQTSSKSPLTPKKVQIVHRIFTERIQSADADEQDMFIRTKQLNQLIANALFNINRAFD